LITITSTADAPLRFDLRVAGVAAYLDNFAILEFAKPYQAIRRERFVKALVKANGSLLISVTNCVELAALQGRSAASVRSFLNELGVHWVPVELDPRKVMAREAQGRTENACLAVDLMHAFFQDRTAELFAPKTIVDLSPESFCQLGAIMDWMGERREKMTQNAEALDKILFEVIQNLRAKYDADPKSIDHHLPPIPWDQRLPATFVWTHINRGLVREAKGYRLKKGDGRDLCHAVVGAAYGSFAALDKHWKRRIEALPKPNALAKIYYAPELDQLVADLEAYANAPVTMNPGSTVSTRKPS